MTPSPAATLVVPVRSFDGKTRLAGALADDDRAALARTLAERVVQAGLDAGMTVTVVSNDDAVRTWAETRGLRVVDDPAHGLNAAAAAGIEGVTGRWILAHADLPLVTSGALTSVAAAEGSLALVPSLDGGTNVISGTGAIRFQFGVGSFHRHLAAHPDATVISDASLAVDIDTIVQLRALEAVDPALASASHG